MGYHGVKEKDLGNVARVDLWTINYVKRTTSRVADNLPKIDFPVVTTFQSYLPPHIMEVLHAAAEELKVTLAPSIFRNFIPITKRSGIPQAGNQGDPHWEDDAGNQFN